MSARAYFWVFCTAIVTGAGLIYGVVAASLTLTFFLVATAAHQPLSKSNSFKKSIWTMAAVTGALVTIWLSDAPVLESCLLLAGCVVVSLFGRELFK